MTPRAGLLRESRGLLAAVTFLTRAPAAGRLELDADDVRRAALYFPVVGWALGAGVGAVATRLAPRCSPPLAAALALAAGTVATGALHVDALADTADALGTRSRARALEVMRDSTIGAFGATAVSLGLAVKLLALSELARRGAAARSAAAAGAVSRAVPVALAAALPYAREGTGGTGVALTRGSAERAAGAGTLALLLAVATGGDDGAVLAGLAAVACLGCARCYRTWLGGVTGDALGAALELTETAALVAAVALAAPSR
jgi:adenosylcobinamide-GDP ribazoletransferase